MARFSQEFETFDSWFKAQFGPRPLSPNQEEAAENRLSDLKLLVKNTEEKLSLTRNWDVQYNAALKAHAARGL